MKKSENIHSDKESLRVATPQLVASYRAKRIKCDVLGEIGAGIGGQTISFAKECKKVIAVEKDEQRASFLKKNLESFENAQILVDDAISNPQILKSADTIFCDPQRPHEEKVRSLDSVSPSPKDLLEIFSGKSVAMEIPPQISPDKIALDAEKEYISVNFRLNRLTLYFQKLKKVDVSAISLPSQEKITSDMPNSQFEESKLRAFIYELDTGLEKSGLSGRLAALHPLFLFRKSKYTLLTSDEKVSSAFLKRFKVLAQAKSLAEAKDKLRLLKAKAAVLHGRIAPEEYWNTRNKLESGLFGTRTLHVFLDESEYIITTMQIE